METKEISLKKVSDHMDKDHTHGESNVKVMVDSQNTTVHRGSYIVADFKRVIGIEASKELDQVIDGQFIPLDDSERIVIKGNEEFISHARAGGSS